MTMMSTCLQRPQWAGCNRRSSIAPRRLPIVGLLHRVYHTPPYLSLPSLVIRCYCTSKAVRIQVTHDRSFLTSSVTIISFEKVLLMSSYVNYSLVLHWHNRTFWPCMQLMHLNTYLLTWRPHFTFPHADINDLLVKVLSKAVPLENRRLVLPPYIVVKIVGRVPWRFDSHEWLNVLYNFMCLFSLSKLGRQRNFWQNIVCKLRQMKIHTMCQRNFARFHGAVEVSSLALTRGRCCSI